MDIRPAERRDVKALALLLGELAGAPMTEAEAEDRLRLCENSPIDFLYVYEEDGEVLGVCAFRIRENIESVSRYGEVSAIVVRPDARRRGIGRIMLDVMEELARGKGCLGLWLVSGFGREEEAHTFYRDYGFEVTGYRFVKRF
jgi:N-acetylglutamate synthase-like GNAT family acetyltransferase